MNILLEGDYFVYLLECADGSLYCGVTTDLERRVGEHNTSKKGARYTRARRPVVLKYSEKYETMGAALSREAVLKRFSRAEKLRLITEI